MNHCIFALALALALGVTAATPAQEGAGTEPTSPRATPFVVLSELPGGRIQEAIDAWLAEHEVALGIQPDGAYVAAAVEQVAEDTASQNWGLARDLAFTRARGAVLATFVEFLGATVTAETVATLVDDPQVRGRLLQSRPQELDDEIRRKVELLSVAKLDAALRELGVSEERIAELTATEKHVELAQSIRRTARVRSIGRVSGMRVLKTFEGEDALGHYSIGVIAVWSPRQQALARRILMGNTGQAKDGETVGVDVEDLFRDADGTATSGEALARLLADEFGVRLVTDTDGRQAIVAFAQSAPVISRGDSRNLVERRLDAALQRANTNARALIQQFLTSAAETGSESRAEELYEKFLLEHQDGTIDDVGDSVAFSDWFHREIRTRSEGRQCGVVTLKQWRANHPIYGHPLVGVVVKWSPSSAEAAELARLGGTPEQRGDAGGGVQPGVRGSRDFEGKGKKIRW